MARPRTPTASLELRGAFKRNPSRKEARANEPVVDSPLGEPPESFHQVERVLWAEMAEEGHWLTGADRFLFEIAVRLMAMHRTGCLGDKNITKLIQALVRLGFSPTERSKIKAPGSEAEKPVDPFAGF
jgi:hypothetical protein